MSDAERDLEAVQPQVIDPRLRVSRRRYVSCRQGGTWHTLSPRGAPPVPFPPPANIACVDCGQRFTWDNEQRRYVAQEGG